MNDFDFFMDTSICMLRLETVNYGMQDIYSLLQYENIYLSEEVRL